MKNLKSTADKEKVKKLKLELKKANAELKVFYKEYKSFFKENDKITQKYNLKYQQLTDRVYHYQDELDLISRDETVEIIKAKDFLEENGYKVSKIK